MFNKYFLSFAAVVLIASGCASVNSVSLTPIPSQKGRPVQTEVSKMIFLGFNFDNDYVEQIVPNLQRQCPGGVISGILTKDETISYFILFNRRVVVTGFCNTGVSADANGSRKSAGDKPETKEN